MTREAKIGLLVALAFILVVGILLSDHVTSATREPAAPLTQIEESIRGSTTTPGTAPQLQNPPRLPGQTQEPATSAYVHPQPQGDVIASLGTPQGSQDPQNAQPGASPAQPPVVEAGAGDPWNIQPGGGSGGAIQPQAQTDPLTENSGPNAPQPLQRLVDEHGTELQVVGQQGGRGGAAGAPGNATQMAGVKQYTIQPNDSLSKIVAKHLGRYTPANEALILGLNPKLKANKDRIIVGEKVLVPATASAAESLRAAGTSTASNAAPTQPPRASRGPTASAQEPQRSGGSATAPRSKASGSSAARTYVVKDGDTLWSIAAKQLGSGARHAEILRLNADKLSGPDELQVGMKLKLPGSEQRVASAD